jgi:small conductance mechanosensitive channel
VQAQRDPAAEAVTGARHPCDTGATMPDNLSQGALDKVGATLLGLKIALVELAIRYGLQILAALIILVVGFRIARWSGGLLEAWLTRKGLDVSLKDLVVRVFRVLVMAATVVVAAEKMGIPVTSLVAGVGVAGVGAGFALQGVLGNVFAGLTILFTRPFKVGEFIEILGVHGQVTQITVSTTTLLHADMSSVVIPNRKIVGEILHNYGTQRQVDLQVGVAYATDLGKAFSVAHDAVTSDARVLAQPAPLVGIKDLGDSAIVLSVRAWIPVADFENTRIAVYRALVEAFRKNGVDMPFPQREIRVLGPAPKAGVLAS